jgi:ribosomal protein S18 acetylase RimI-like enzyme
MARVPAVEPRLLALLGRVWPALPPAIARADALGFSWAAVSTPFVHYEGSRAVAHVGVIDLPLVIGGRQRMVGSIHAVCTDADRRRRGHADALMAAALAHCRVRYGTVILTTLIPEFYGRLGFRTVAEHAFTRPLGATPPSAGGRRLSESAEDAQLLRRLLAARTPVSDRLGSLDAPTVFVFGLLLGRGDFSRAYYHEALDVVSVHEVVGRTLVLYDVVGATLPPLTDLLEAIGADADRVLALFSPERFGSGFEPEAWDAARARAVGDNAFAGLMARGAWSPGADAFMLPPLSRT